jgi:hypothetical protein
LSKTPTYTITGTFAVAGKQPGERLTDEDTATLDIPTLIEAGLITPNTKTTTPEE